MRSFGSLRTPRTVLDRAIRVSPFMSIRFHDLPITNDVENLESQRLVDRIYANGIKTRIALESPSVYTNFLIKVSKICASRFR